MTDRIILKIMSALMVAMTLLLPLPARGAFITPAPDARENMIRSLAKASTATDSITLLYNIYDLSTEQEADSVGAKIFNLARRQGYEEVAIDILRDMAQLHFEDSTVLRKIQFILENDFDPSDLQKETLIYVKIYRAYLDMGNTPENELKQKIIRIINHYGAEFSHDPYERLMQQFLQCIFIGHETQGELLTQYLDILERLLQKMPRQSDKLKARLYRQKAYSFTVNSDPKRAVEADKKLLALYDHTEQVNHRQGRPFRSLDHFRHNSMMRMLSNYPALTLAEVDSLCNRIDEIEKTKPSLADKKHAVPPHRVFRMLAHGDFAAAVEPLKALVADETDHIGRRMLLKKLMNAADKSGRKTDLLEASRAYAASMEDYLDSKISECFRELQIIYDVDHLRSDSTSNELKMQREIGRQRSMVLNILLWVGAAVTLMLLVFVALYRKSRTLSASLAATNERLTAQHDELVRRTGELQRAIDDAHKAEQNKDAFIKYISSTISLPLRSMMEYSNKVIESSRGDEKPFLKRFGEVIRENYEALNRISAKLQELSARHSDDNNDDDVSHPQS